MEKTIYNIKVSDLFIAKYEVTQELYKSVMGNNPSYSKGSSKPVERVSWYDAVKFCNKLSEKKGLEKCYTINGEDVSCDFSKKGYRLPTEAEWEYAARGGNKSKGYKYSGSNNIDEIAWVEVNSDYETHNVGLKKANELGIYDMCGNIREWCWDGYCLANPSRRYSCNIRGGSYCAVNWLLSLKYSDNYSPSGCRKNLGFRLARTY